MPYVILVLLILVLQQGVVQIHQDVYLMNVVSRHVLLVIPTDVFLVLLDVLMLIPMFVPILIALLMNVVKISARVGLVTKAMLSVIRLYYVQLLVVPMTFAVHLLHVL